MNVRKQLSAWITVIESLPVGDSRIDGIVLAAHSTFALMDNAGNMPKELHDAVARHNGVVTEEPQGKAETPKQDTPKREKSEPRQAPLKRHPDGTFTGVYNPAACQAWAGHKRQCMQTDDLDRRGMCQKYHANGWTDIITNEDRAIIAEMAADVPAQDTLKTPKRDRVQCAATLKDGSGRCKRHATTGAYCSAHKGMATDAPKTATSTVDESTDRVTVLENKFDTMMQMMQQMMQTR